MVLTARRLLIATGGGSLSGGSGGLPAPDPDLLILLNGQSGDGEYKIGLGYRVGGTYTEYATPIITKGAATTWNDGHVKDPAWIDGYSAAPYGAFVSGYDGTKYQLGIYEADEPEGPWTEAANPILTVGAGGSIDDAGVNFATPLYEPTDTGNECKVWFGANDGTTQRIAYASGPTWASLTKHGTVVDVGTSGTYSDEGVLPMYVLKDGATYHLFGGGRQGTTVPRWQGAHWTFTDPEGTYTAGSNPILLARFNDAGTSVVPTADVTTGQTTVQLTTTAPYFVGEPVTVLDGDSTAEVFYIESIDSGTQVTLDHAVVGNFTGGGKVFRSFAFNSVLPRTVRRITGGGYEMFGTPFQPVDDLTQPASKLWEGSLEWTSSTLTGPWAYNYVAGRGLLFPLDGQGLAWHNRSAENPSVMVGAAGSGAPEEPEGGADFTGWTGSTLHPFWEPVYSSPGDPGFGLDSDFMANLSQVSVSGDVLTITAQKVGSIWQSACIGTRDTYSFLYGTIECEILYPDGQGVWPAFWLIEEGTVATPPEIDILEAYPGDPGMIGGTAFISTALHMASGIQSEIYNTGSNNTAEWHTYRMVWAPGNLKFYFDDFMYKEMGSDIPAVPLYPILNLALGATSYRTDGTTPTTLVMQARNLKVWEA